MQKRVFIVTALLVIAALILWPEDEETPDKGKKSANSAITQPRKTGLQPARQPRTPTPGYTEQTPWLNGYSPRQGIEPAPAFPYSQNSRGPTPYGSGYGFRPPETMVPDQVPEPASQFRGTVPSQYPGVAPAAPEFNYHAPPGYTFRPLDDEEKSSQRYTGDYPKRGMFPPAAPPAPFQPNYGTAPAQPWLPQGYGPRQTLRGGTDWDRSSGR